MASVAVQRSLFELPEDAAQRAAAATLRAGRQRDRDGFRTQLIARGYAPDSARTLASTLMAMTAGRAEEVVQSPATTVDPILAPVRHAMRGNRLIAVRVRRG